MGQPAFKETERTINEESKNILFRDARTYNAWQNRNVDDEILKELFELVKLAPTSANCSPMRVLFIKSESEKNRLKPYLMEGNIDKTMSAPVTAVIAHDMRFYEKLPKLFPHTDAKSWFEGNDSFIRETAFRNGSLQGGYFILAARGLGLDCGPMSGFDAEGTKREFFPDKPYEVNFLCNIGYGSPENLYPRSPRFEFDEVCEII